MIGKTILHYKILEKLGEGGMGVVYQAEDTKLKRDVAIKFLPRQIAASEEERQRFKIEAQAAAALNHPHIATIYAIEEVDEQIFIVMEYIDGRELRKVIQSEIPDPQSAIDIATQIAAGLQAAHEKGIVHRDIKSANIMVTDKGQVKIMDFGLAKLSGRTMLTKEGTTLGTVAYMSPEQARGENVDHRTDIWAFGVVLYEMLTGELPFKGDYEQAVIYSILNEEPDFSDIPADFLPVVKKALAKKVGARFQNIEELLADLRALTGFEALSGLSAKAGPSSRMQPARQRSMLLLAGGLAVVVLTVAAMGYFFSKRGPTDLKIVSTRPLTSAPGFEGQP
ncbi:MAG: serine/threonine-protein kinase, partial [bacterium]